MGCILIILGLCHPTATQLTLGTFQATSNFVDMYGTLRNMEPRPGIIAVEHNPIARPFVTHGPVVGYAAAASESISYAFIGYKMKNSRTWLRHVWWVPQVLNITSHSVCATFTFEHHL